MQHTSLPSGPSGSVGRHVSGSDRVAHSPPLDEEDEAEGGYDMASEGSCCARTAMSPDGADAWNRRCLKGALRARGLVSTRCCREWRRARQRKRDAPALEPSHPAPPLPLHHAKRRRRVAVPRLAHRPVARPREDKHLVLVLRLGALGRARLCERRDEDVVLEPLERAHLVVGVEARRARDRRLVLALRRELGDGAAVRGREADGELLALDGPAGGGRARGEGGARGERRGGRREVVDGERGGGRQDGDESRVGRRVGAQVEEGFGRDGRDGCVRRDLRMCCRVSECLYSCVGLEEKEGRTSPPTRAARRHAATLPSLSPATTSVSPQAKRTKSTGALVEMRVVGWASGVECGSADESVERSEASEKRDRPAGKFLGERTSSSSRLDCSACSAAPMSGRERLTGSLSGRDGPAKVVADGERVARLGTATSEVEGGTEAHRDALDGRGEREELQRGGRREEGEMRRQRGPQRTVGAQGVPRHPPLVPPS